MARCTVEWLPIHLRHGTQCPIHGCASQRLAREVGLKPNAKWVLAEGGDSSGMNRSIPIEKIMDDCLITWAMNGEALRPERDIQRASSFLAGRATCG